MIPGPGELSLGFGQDASDLPLTGFLVPGVQSGFADECPLLGAFKHATFRGPKWCDFPPVFLWCWRVTDRKTCYFEIVPYVFFGGSLGRYPWSNLKESLSETDANLTWICSLGCLGICHSCHGSSWGFSMAVETVVMIPMAAKRLGLVFGLSLCTMFFFFKFSKFAVTQNIPNSLYWWYRWYFPVLL